MSEEKLKCPCGETYWPTLGLHGPPLTCRCGRIYGTRTYDMEQVMQRIDELERAVRKDCIKRSEVVVTPGGCEHSNMQPSIDRLQQTVIHAHRLIRRLRTELTRPRERPLDMPGVISSIDHYLMDFLDGYYAPPPGIEPNWPPMEGFER
jgi:hypothetical protein